MIEEWWLRIAYWLENDTPSKRLFAKVYQVLVALCVINIIIKLLMKGW